MFFVGQRGSTVTLLQRNHSVLADGSKRSAVQELKTKSLFNNNTLFREQTRPLIQGRPHFLSQPPASERGGESSSRKSLRRRHTREETPRPLPPSAGWRVRVGGGGVFPAVSLEKQTRKQPCNACNRGEDTQGGRRKKTNNVKRKGDGGHQTENKRAVNPS